MRTEALLLCLIACLPSNSTPVINLPDRTSVGQPPPHYDPCVKYYAQQAQLGIEERICVDSIGNTNVQEYFDTIRDYPCTWHPTWDGKTRCIPAQPVWNYFADVQFYFDVPYSPAQCLEPIVAMEIDPRSWYVGIPDRKGKYSVYEIGKPFTGNIFWLPYWNEVQEYSDCTSLHPIDLFYPRLSKNQKWFYVGQEVDPALFQER